MRCWRSGSDIRGAIEVLLPVGSGCAVSSVVVEDEVGRLSETVDMGEAWQSLPSAFLLASLM
jgi:hypothetical protein